MKPFNFFYKHVDSAFDGEGARIAGGRWNKIGIPMIYTADSLALAVLEITVHLSRNDLLYKNYCRISVKFDSSLVASLNPAELPDDWDSLPPSESTQNIGAQWALSQKSVILKVPSTVVREEFKYLINPVHPKFEKILIGSPRPKPIYGPAFSAHPLEKNNTLFLSFMK